MSGGSDSTSTVNSIPDWAVPYGQNYLQRAAQVADLPYQQYSGQRTAGLNQAQLGAMNAVQQRAANGSPITNASGQMLQDTAAGQYLGAGNPYLTQQIDAANADTVRAYNLATRPQQQAQEAQSGSFGNSGLQQMQLEQQRQLGQTLANTSNAMRYQNYSAERGNQMQAAGLAPTYAAQDYTDAQQLLNVGNQAQQAEQAGLDTQYQDWANAQNYPRQQLQTMGNALGINFGNNSTTYGAGGNGTAQALGGALGAYAAYNGGGGGSSSSTK